MTSNRTRPAAVPNVFDNRADIQAIVATGFNSLKSARFLLLQVTNRSAAQKWLRDVLHAGLVANVPAVGDALRQGHLRAAVSIAMTHEGLIEAGVRPSSTHPFPSTFADGMGNLLHRKKLGDTQAPADWRWTDTSRAAGPQTFVAHWLAACYWDGQRGSDHPLLQAPALRAAGFRVEEIPADPAFIQKDGSAIEPFGFRDGIAQPVVDGLRGGQSKRHRHIHNSARPQARDHLIAPGEFVLGYPNEYGDLAYAPDSAAGAPLRASGSPRFAANGSYVAVRQIVQDVKGLRAFEAEHAAAVGGGPASPSIVERMVGRYRDGRPLGLPDRAKPDFDDFRYQMYDAQGFGCPRGAHVRRANPRDLLGVDPTTGRPDTRLHRLLRRGRSYVLDSGEQGLFFMALNADLDRQFAFVQGQWIQQSTFGDLADEADPLLGTSHRNFTAQCPLLAQRLTQLPRFTRLVGGGYFFLPGLSALGEIAASG